MWPETPISKPKRAEPRYEAQRETEFDTISRRQLIKSKKLMVNLGGGFGRKHWELRRDLETSRRCPERVKR